MQVVTDSLLTTYSRAGKGRVVVLLHGWGDSSASFSGLEGELSKTFDVINVDLPGFGQTQAPTAVWGLDEYANFVHNFLAKINAGNVYAFIGHSNGGALLIRGLGSGKLQASKLVLIASAGIRNRQKAQKALLKIVAKAGKATTFFLPERHKKKLRKKLYGVAGSDMLVVPELQETFKKTVAQDVTADAGNLKIPTLLIYGSNDPATPVADGQRLHQAIQGSQLKIVPGATHYVHQEQPGIVLGYIREFLA
jgi:pimeloyl-ACP methyl ester carboxylesterase